MERTPSRRSVATPEDRRAPFGCQSRAAAKSMSAFCAPVMSRVHGALRRKCSRSGASRRLILPAGPRAPSSRRFRRRRPGTIPIVSRTPGPACSVPVPRGGQPEPLGRDESQPPAARAASCRAEVHRLGQSDTGHVAMLTPASPGQVPSPCRALGAGSLRRRRDQLPCGSGAPTRRAPPLTLTTPLGEHRLGALDRMEA